METSHAAATPLQADKHIKHYVNKTFYKQQTTTTIMPLQKEHLESAECRHGKSSPDPGDFQKSKRTKVQRCSCDNIFTKIRSALPETWATLWKNALAHNLKNHFKTFLYLHPDAGCDPDADVFQNLISCFLSIDSSVVKFSWKSSSSFYVKLLTNKQKDKKLIRDRWQAKIKVMVKGNTVKQHLVGALYSKHNWSQLDK